MTVFRLAPVADHLEHHDWMRSTYKGVCHVAAGDEREARRLVKMEFDVAVGKAGPGAKVPTNPWLNPDLTECVAVASWGEEPPQGVVTVPKEGRG